MLGRHEQAVHLITRGVSYKPSPANERPLLQSGDLMQEGTSAGGWGENEGNQSHRYLQSAPTSCATSLEPRLLRDVTPRSYLASVATPTRPLQPKDWEASSCHLPSLDGSLTPRHAGMVERIGDWAHMGMASRSTRSGSRRGDVVWPWLDFLPPSR